jgi:cytochrome c biogenesis protein CcdA
MVLMLDSITEALKQASSQPLGLLLAMLLGTLSAVTSACCTLPVLGVLVGYSGAQENMSRNLALKKTLFFTLGTIVSMMIIGGVAGFVGQVANASLGRYWMVFAGIVLILFGLTTLKLIPFKISFGKFDKIKKRFGMSGVMLTGFIMGGVIATLSLCCNPVIFVVIGVAVLLGHIFQAALLLGMFAIGFSLPLGAVLLGLSLSKARFLPKSADNIVRWIAGGIQLIVGFYFIITF